MNLQDLKNLIWKPNRPLILKLPPPWEISPLIGPIVSKLMSGSQITLWDRFKLWLHGWEVKDINYGGAFYVLLSEKEASHGGCGAFLARKNLVSTRVLMAPHSFFDEKTGDLALSMFLSNPRFQAVFFNTLHRYKHEDGSKEEREPPSANHADACHWQDHPLAIMSAMCFKDFGMELVQLHGFKKLDGYPDAIISSGASVPNALRDAILPAMKQAFPEYSIMGYPEEVNHHGGTQNLQGSASRNLGGMFAHIELADTFRDDLSVSETLRDSLGVVLGA